MQMAFITDAPWTQLTYKIIGLAMEVHNELGPGHREYVYHNAMVAKLKQADLNFEDEPDCPVILDDNTIVGGNRPDLVVEHTVIVELKARSHLMTKDEQAQVIGYFAALSECPVALLINFGRPRLEQHRMLPPKKLQAYRREKWAADKNG
jgi:GxxExxY protein